MNHGAFFFFSAQRHLITHSYYIQTSMSDVISSDSPSTSICHLATKSNRILVGRFNLYCHKIEGITFGADLVY